jgi:hypothetical protein
VLIHIEITVNPPLGLPLITLKAQQFSDVAAVLIWIGERKT